MDLLERAKELINQGNTQINSQMTYLQTLTQQASPQPKIGNKATTPSNSQNNSKIPNFNTLYLMSGLVPFGVAVLAIGYWLGKKKNKLNF